MIFDDYRMNTEMNTNEIKRERSRTSDIKKLFKIYPPLYRVSVLNQYFLPFEVSLAFFPFIAFAPPKEGEGE